jgi:5-oxoprolinase (ATP-hydrolysing)
MRHEIWIDRGGTFTDCIALDRETGLLAVAKVPSSDQAALDGIRRLLRLAPGAPIPPCEIRLGTTIATNALLERRGVRSALVITRGFADLLRIGDQQRPDLFALAIEQHAPLHEAVIEVDARCDADGRVLERPDLASLRRELEAVRASGIDSLAVVIVNDYARGELERELAGIARSLGFAHISLSSRASPELGLLARAETTVLDAYLTPLLAERLALLSGSLPGSRLRMMQSSGALTEVARFRGPAALLSGPAGGVVAVARIAEQAGLGPVIGFDMGGTSTDVSRSAGGVLERVYETHVAGTRVRAPLLAVHTVAAGGGSICRFDGHKLTVGPDSAGALPGPLCYGHAEASELTVTDVNLLLGRLDPAHFPFPLDVSRAEQRLLAIQQQLSAAGHELGREAVLEGFLSIANLAMAEAICEVSLARGHDVREHSLLVLGGAGGQHACSLARRLGVRRIVFHPLAGVLAAFGLGVADVGWHGVREAGAAALSEGALAALASIFTALEAEGRELVTNQASPGDRIGSERTLELRYRGSETTLSFPPASAAELAAAFHARHRELFGHARPEHPLELVSIRVDVTARRALPMATFPARAAAASGPQRHTRLYSGGRFWERVPVYETDEVPVERVLTGPLLVADSTGTIVIDPGFTLERRKDGLCVAEVRADGPKPTDAPATGHERPDPILLEVMGRRFMSIAEQMGQVLRRTALSTNIRERLDFSCAVFDANAALVANAPHIPVHLGAMSESVRAVVECHPELEPGDLFVTNDPALGGSHLPDITLVAPVHDTHGRLRYFTASRGHHADVGGLTPGSMPPASKSIADEGVVFSALRVVRGGHFDREMVLAALRAGPHPARRPDDNLADLGAQIAAVRAGARLLAELSAELGDDLVSRYMAHVQDEAAAHVSAWLQSLGPIPRHFADALDDGTPIVVALSVDRGRLSVDFTGTGAEHASNLNAPRAVTSAAVIYVLRVLAGRKIPLNAGCLRHVDIRLPAPSLLAPSARAAVAAGNVETSQRVVDVLFGALGSVAASQGSMNNLCFGNESFGYYETIAGGAGAGPDFAGASAVHTHMTNTRLTDPEVLERRFPVRVRELSLRRGSGGAGHTRGGDGLCRELEFLEPLAVSLISQRRTIAPFGLAGGAPGAKGRNLLNGAELPGSFEIQVKPGDRLRIETPGGGGYGMSSLGRPDLDRREWPHPP